MTDPARRHLRRSGAPSPRPSPLHPVVYLFIYLSILSIYLPIYLSSFNAAPAGPGPRRRCRPSARPPAVRGQGWINREALPSPRCDRAVTQLPALPALPLLVFTSPCSGIAHLQLRMARWMWRAWLGLGVAALARLRVLPEDLKRNQPRENINKLNGECLQLQGSKATASYTLEAPWLWN